MEPVQKYVPLKAFSFYVKKSEPKRSGSASPLRVKAYRTSVRESHTCLFKAISQKKIPPDFIASQYLGLTPMNPLESSRSLLNPEYGLTGY
jgi:hypothetical protein